MRNSRLLTSALVGAMIVALVSISFTGSAIAATPKTAKNAATASPRPSITMGEKMGENEGDHRGSGNDEGSAEDVARHAAMQKFQDCLAAQGVTLPQGPGFGRDKGTKPGAMPQPSMNDKQKAAFDACNQYAPQFGPRDGFKAGMTPTPRASSITMKMPTPAPKNSAKPKTLPSTNSAMSAAYIACLNKAGVDVKSMADINSLDRGSAKVASALKSCAGKTPFKK